MIPRSPIPSQAQQIMGMFSKAFDTKTERLETQPGRFDLIIDEQLGDDHLWAKLKWSYSSRKRRWRLVGVELLVNGEPPDKGGLHELVRLLSRRRSSTLPVKTVGAPTTTPKHTDVGSRKGTMIRV